MAWENGPVHPLEFGMSRTEPEYAPEIVAEMNSVVKLSGGVVLAQGTRARPIRRGQVLARLSADVAGLGEEGQYIARKSGEASVLASSGATSITLTDATPFAVGDTVEFGGTADDETITAVDYDTNVITLGSTLSANVAVGERVSVAASGQGVARGIAANSVSFSRLAGMTGRTSMYIEGTFYPEALIGLDDQARIELGAIDVPSSYGTTRTLVRIRAGATGIVA